MPMAGWPSAAAAAMTSPTRAAPSSIENSVWRWRWVNESGTALRYPQPVENYIGVIPRVPRSEVAGGTAVGDGLAGGAGGEAALLAAHLLELGLGRHLLGEQRGLD